jgi:hypothetical protein
MTKLYKFHNENWFDIRDYYFLNTKTEHFTWNVYHTEVQINAE